MEGDRSPFNPLHALIEDRKERSASLVPAPNQRAHRYRLYAIVPCFRIWLSLFVFLALGLGGCQGSTYLAHSSPDGRFCVVLRRYPQLMAMPGQSGDAPGVIELYAASGKQLAEIDLPMMQSFQEVRWKDYQVDVVADLRPVTWTLPEEFRMAPGYLDSQGKADGCRRFTKAHP